MELSSFKRDVAHIEAGSWVDGIPGMGGLRLRVRGLGSKLFQATHSRLARAVPKNERDRDGSLRPAAAVRVMGEAVAETILLDWDGITEGGEPIPYDADRAKAMLTDPEFEPFLDAVIWAARVVDNGRAETVEELAKNSETPSASSSKQAAKKE